MSKRQIAGICQIQFDIYNTKGYCAINTCNNCGHDWLWCHLGKDVSQIIGYEFIDVDCQCHLRDGQPSKYRSIVNISRNLRDNQKILNVEYVRMRDPTIRKTIRICMS
jgi:hypothetical protein